MIFFLCPVFSKEFSKKELVGRAGMFLPRQLYRTRICIVVVRSVFYFWKQMNSIFPLHICLIAKIGATNIYCTQLLSGARLKMFFGGFSVACFYKDFFDSEEKNELSLTVPV